MSEALGFGRLYALPNTDTDTEDAGFHAEDDSGEAPGAEVRGLRELLDRLFNAALGAVQGAAVGWANPSWARESAHEGEDLATAVETLMSRRVEVIAPDATLDEAASCLWERDCGALPVVDPRMGRRVIGVVTDRDLCMAGWSRGVSLRELRVGDVMTRELVACRSDASIGEAHRLMRQHRIRRLPVVDCEGGLVGVIALADLVHRALRAPPESQRAEAAAVLETLGAICTPPRAE